MKKWLRVKVLGSRSRVQTQVSAGPSLSKDAPLPCPCMVIHTAPVPGRTLAAISGIPLPREHAAVWTGSKEVSAGRAAWNSISGPALCPLVVEGKGVKEPGESRGCQDPPMSPVQTQRMDPPTTALRPPAWPVTCFGSNGGCCYIRQ